MRLVYPILIDVGQYHFGASPVIAAPVRVWFQDAIRGIASIAVSQSCWETKTFPFWQREMTNTKRKNSPLERNREEQFVGPWKAPTEKAPKAVARIPSGGKNMMIHHGILGLITISYFQGQSHRSFFWVWKILQMKGTSKEHEDFEHTYVYI